MRIRAATGTAGYVQLAHNYPVGHKARFRMDDKMDSNLGSDNGIPLKGVWRSN